MKTVIELDEDKDERAFSDDQDPNAALLEEAENKIRSFVYDDVYVRSKGAMADRRTRWERFIKRYRGERASESEPGPFDRVCPPKLAPRIDLKIAKLLQTVIPDRERMDFFELVPESTPEGQPPNQQDMLAADYATRAIRNDFIDGDLAGELPRVVWDAHVIGNGIMIATMELDVCFRYIKAPNPEYNPAMPYKISIVDGEPVPEPVSPTITKRIPYRQFDAPKMRYLNPRNVFPTELDRNNLTECTGICIYDTVKLCDLQDDAISDGGYLYANLDKVKYGDESETVPEITGALAESASWAALAGRGAASKCLDRVTYWGRFRLEEVLEGMDEGDTDTAIAALAEKFDMDPEKLKNWNTWVIEVVNNGSTVIRIQPSPYFKDAVPIIHFQTYPVPGHTWADGEYDRGIEEELKRNAIGQYQLEGLCKAVRPPVMAIAQMFDETWWQENDGKLVYKPNMLIKGRIGSNINEAIQVMKFDPTPITMADAAISKMDKDIDDSVGLVPSQIGNGTAQQLQDTTQHSDILQEERALRFESTFFGPMIGLMLDLHHQFTDEPKAINYRNDANEQVFMTVPPEVWLGMYNANLLGWRQTGNIAVRAMNMKEFATVAFAQGVGNAQTILPDWAKLLGLKNPEKYLQAPPPPPPEIKMTANVNIPYETLPPTVGEKVMAAAGVQWDAQDLAAAGAIKNQADLAAQMESGQESAQAAQSRDQSNGGAPIGAREATVGNQGQGLAEPSHHAPGEVENRQRGLHDAEGLNRAAAQTVRNPMNGRRANA